MPKILVVDNSPERIAEYKKHFKDLNSKTIHSVEYVSTARGAIEKLGSTLYDILLLDHDLTGEGFNSIEDKNTGSEIARYLKDHSGRLAKTDVIYIHSLNDSGASNMKRLIPFGNIKHVKYLWTDDKFSEYFGKYRGRE